MWLRRDNAPYLTNKVLSVLIAFGMAIYALSFKKTFYLYKIANPDAANISAYAFTYWLLFIYYSFAALEELIELYAVYMQREKGALGLLFEMNYFLGFAVAIYIVWFVNSTTSAISDPLFVGLFDFLKIQAILFYVSIGISVLLVGCFYKINSDATRKSIKHEDKDKFVKNDE